uniref:AlgP family protein n=1 Tax=Pseudomonas protegens TaxID=380021 RepID=UPI003905A55C
MSASKKPVNTPLHLLQQLSGSLLEHLENACSQALADAEKLLAKLEKQRGKAQEKLHKSRTKLQDAAAAGKAKAQAKAKTAVSELEDLLDALKERQAQTRSYILQLKRDAQESLKLAQGVGRVKEAVAKALSTRDAQSDAVAAKKPAAKPAAKAPAKSAAKPAAKPAAKKLAPIHICRCRPLPSRFYCRSARPVLS